MASAKKQKQEVSPKAVGIVTAILLVVGGGNWVLEQFSGEDDEESAREEVVQIDAPIDVTMLPYYSSSGTFERSGESSIRVETDIYMDDEGRGFAKTV